ncbi:MAG: hypothetical protein ACKO21_12105 [Nodosilinea sp.]
MIDDCTGVIGMYSPAIAGVGDAIAIVHLQVPQPDRHAGVEGGVDQQSAGV